MLGTGAYTKTYIDDCRALIARQVAAYDKVAKGGGAAASAFEPLHFNSLVLVLDHCFMHRLRGQEGKDGNPMNEVRLLTASILENGGELVADKQIKLKPETSILGLAVGDRVAIAKADFTRLAEAYFDAIQATFGE